jgi:hypothetical protein
MDIHEIARKVKIATITRSLGGQDKEEEIEKRIEALQECLRHELNLL